MPGHPSCSPRTLIGFATVARRHGAQRAHGVLLRPRVRDLHGGRRCAVRAGRSFVGRGIRPTVRRFQLYNSSVRRYYVVNATFGAIVAVIDGLALWALGVPAPAVWAILAFVTNFVPNIGFVLGLIPPAVLALVVGGWPLMLAVIAIYCVVNVTLQVLVQPKFVSDAVNLSLTLSFFAVIFWTFIIGPVGAILSIPLTLLVRGRSSSRATRARRGCAGCQATATSRRCIPALLQTRTELRAWAGPGRSAGRWPTRRSSGRPRSGLCVPGRRGCR